LCNPFRFAEKTHDLAVVKIQDELYGKVFKGVSFGRKRALPRALFGCVVFHDPEILLRGLNFCFGFFEHLVKLFADG
jgi:hypothetical protein